MFETLSRSWLLVKDSFAVLKVEKEIMLFPIISAIVSLALIVAFTVPFLFFKIENIANLISSYSIFILLFVYYLVTYFVVLFFNSGLITCANMRLNGEDPKFIDGLRNAARHFWKIFEWATISATVGIILKIIASGKKNILGQIIASILGATWGLLTFFVVPVMIIEDKGPIEAIKRSWELFKRTWGENVVGQLSIGLIFLLLAVLGIIPLIVTIMVTTSFVLWIAAFIFFVIYVSAIAILNSSLNGIFLTALYNYASTGKIPKVYHEETIRNAFKQLPSRLNTFFAQPTV